MWLVFFCCCAIKSGYGVSGSGFNAVSVLPVSNYIHISPSGYPNLKKQMLEPPSDEYIFHLDFHQRKNQLQHHTRVYHCCNFIVIRDHCYLWIIYLCSGRHETCWGRFCRFAWHGSRCWCGLADGAAAGAVGSCFPAEPSDVRAIPALDGAERATGIVTKGNFD